MLNRRWIAHPAGNCHFCPTWSGVRTNSNGPLVRRAAFFVRLAWCAAKSLSAEIGKDSLRLPNPGPVVLSGESGASSAEAANSPDEAPQISKCFCRVDRAFPRSVHQSSLPALRRAAPDQGYPDESPRSSANHLRQKAARRQSPPPVHTANPQLRRPAPFAGTRAQHHSNVPQPTRQPPFAAPCRLMFSADRAPATPSSDARAEIPPDAHLLCLPLPPPAISQPRTASTAQGSGPLTSQLPQQHWPRFRVVLRVRLPGLRDAR